MEFTLNGEQQIYQGDLERSLLDVLRDGLGIVSPKNGCAPQAACGACTVQLNGKAVLSCVIPMKKVDGGVVTTIEGLGEYRQRVYASAFVEQGGVQCGFCIPGIVMQADALINKTPDPSWQEVEAALTPNLCRCTGYKKIISSILTAAKAIRSEEEITLIEQDGRIGSRHRKYQSEKLVLGKHTYVDDVQMPGMVFGALKFSDYPRAKVSTIDISEAAVFPGVIRIFTAKDIPGERTIGLIRKDWPVMVAEGELTRYVGDVLAGVVAETDEIAREAVEKIRVDYQVFAPVTDPHAALDPAAPSIHPGGNLLSRSAIKRGDLPEMESQSKYVASGEFQTQMIEHGFMEPEAAVAFPTADGIQVLSQGQGVYEDRVQISQLLNLPEENVRPSAAPDNNRP